VSIERQLSNVMTGLRPVLVGLPRLWKRVLLVLNDLVLVSLALWLAISLRYNQLYLPPDRQVALVLAVLPLVTVSTFGWFGLYRIVTRYIGHRGTTKIVGCVALSMLVWALIVLISGVQGIPRTVVLFGGGVVAAVVLASRHFAAWLLRSAGVRFPDVPESERKKVLIFGAGPTGVQLLESLRRSGDAKVVGFLDDTANLKGQYVHGLKVYRSEKIERLIEREGVGEVLLALPEATRKTRQDILKALDRFPVRVKTLPAMEDIATGRVSVSDLRPVQVGDLLGRDPVPPNRELLARSIRAKSVMVTGAGGSIGSELVRQILKQQPTRLVLFEQSEGNLYEIEMEVRRQLAPVEPAGRTVVIAVLGSVLDAALIRDTIARHRVDTIYHAAAYKHVPIVEENPIAGLRNNTFGTEVVADVANAAGVERLVLISTDKAVNPTNVMGASKRLAEQILQVRAQEGARTILTMVRFGNVLDSSGSVVKLFRRQIEAGGPVTVTDPNIIRYFMSIPEAAQLVIQAGAMATGGEVFVLDMGDPVKIDDLARSMIRLMGLEVRDEQNPKGDIPITYIGLRPGEKLYEELRLDANAAPTEHPRIMRSHEPARSPDELGRELTILKAAMADGNLEGIEAVLLRTVDGYVPRGREQAAPVAELGRWIAPSRTLH